MEMPSGQGDGDCGGGRLGLGYQVVEKAGIEKWEVYRQDQIEIGGGVGQGCVDSTQRAAAGIEIGDDWGEGGELLGIAYDSHVRSDGAGEIKGARKQGASGEF